METMTNQEYIQVGLSLFDVNFKPVIKLYHIYIYIYIYIYTTSYNLFGIYLIFIGKVKVSVSDILVLTSMALPVSSTLSLIAHVSFSQLAFSA